MRRPHTVIDPADHCGEIVPSRDLRGVTHVIPSSADRASSHHDEWSRLSARFDGRMSDMWRSTIAAVSSCWPCSLSLPHSPAPRINGLPLEGRLAATPPPGHLVDIGGYRLHLWCTGDGAPAVILDTGLGGSTPGWGFVQPDVARFTRVCSYDRAGMGYSDPGPSPRTARRIASELAGLLVRSGIGGPVVLVGASIAGFNVRVFASDHPERAAGLVLVDASHEDQAHEVPPMARFVPLLSTIGVFRLFGVTFGQKSNRWLHQCGNSRRRRVSAQLVTRRRLTRLFIFGRARRKSGARAASSPSLCSSSPVDEEPTRIGDSCNAIKPRCQNEDV